MSVLGNDPTVEPDVAADLGYVIIESFDFVHDVERVARPREVDVSGALLHSRFAVVDFIARENVFLIFEYLFGGFEHGVVKRVYQRFHRKFFVSGRQFAGLFHVQHGCNVGVADGVFHKDLAF